MLLYIERRPGIAAREQVAISVATKTQSYRSASFTEFPHDESGEMHAGKIKRNKPGEDRQR